MPSRRVTCDVLIVGLGVAGIGAGVRAAREGAHTILIERNGSPGGVAVAGMHRFICGLYSNGMERPDATLNGGIAAEICRGLQERAPQRQVQRMGRVHVLPFSTRDLVSTFRALSEREADLEVFYDTEAVAVRMERNAIASVTARHRSAEFEIAPRAVVDCSGDGSVIRMSGARYQVTGPRESQLAGYSVRLKGLRNVDEMLSLRVPYHLAKAVNEKRMPVHLKFTTFAPGDDPDEGYCRLNVPPEGRSRNQRARSDALLAHRHLSRVLDSFKDSIIAETSPRVVDREGPRACGEYTLTADDVLNARKFSDGAVRNAWPIELWDRERGPSYRYLEPGDYHEIPLRCLKLQDVSNCWCAGRCISATREALGSTRVMGTCVSLGEEAGRTAARSL
jgi:2-polyprenyl-6-methoxyphenol hydroxylase-like FAD-dependent oxidoreductase